MQINLETDYAARIVQCLADSGERLDARAISERTGVTQKFSLKILRKLAIAGLVKSYRGVGGGYVLVINPEDITLRQVIEIIGGPIVFSRCQRDDFVCDHPEECNCHFHKIFEETAKEVARRFDEVRFTPRNDTINHQNLR